MSYVAKDIRAAIEAAFDDLDASTRHDVAFHLTDWLKDFEALERCFRQPLEVPPAQLRQVLEAFLIHVPNHLAAAAKLGVDSPVSDIFQVGAVEVSAPE